MINTIIFLILGGASFFSSFLFFHVLCLLCLFTYLLKILLVGKYCLLACLLSFLFRLRPIHPLFRGLGQGALQVLQHFLCTASVKARHKRSWVSFFGRWRWQSVIWMLQRLPMHRCGGVWSEAAIMVLWHQVFICWLSLFLCLLACLLSFGPQAPCRAKQGKHVYQKEKFGHAKTNGITSGTI